MRQGAERREKKPARTQCHEVVAPRWNAQASLGQNGGAGGAAPLVMPWDHCTPRAICNLRSTTQRPAAILRSPVTSRSGVPNCAHVLAFAIWALCMLSRMECTEN